MRRRVQWDDQVTGKQGIDCVLIEIGPVVTFELSISKIPSALKPLTLASPAGRLPNHDGRTDFVVFVAEIRA